jgi:hypothetical protein
VQLAFSIVLAALYVGLAISLGALTPWKHPLGALYWFLVPTVGMTCAGMAVAGMVQRFAPVPWSAQRELAAAPRRVHLSWRAATSGPALLPVLFFPWYIASLMWTLGGRGPRSMAAVIFACALLAVGLSIRKIRREHRLLRDGAVAMALVEYRTNTGEDPWEWIRYRFVTARGIAVSGRGYDRGYRIGVGETVPVFYDPNRPKDHIAACACWLEVG